MVLYGQLLSYATYSSNYNPCHDGCGEIMKIALIGYGKMGKMVKKHATKRGYDIVACFTHPNTSFSQVKNADVCIDFTTPSAVIETIKKLSPFKKPIVIGTTGWDVEAIKPYAKEMGILYAPNFSLGIALFTRLLKKTYKLLSPYYESSGVEIHHKEKRDIPSGTALNLSAHVPGLKFRSVRMGSQVGSHQVIFNGDDDLIELTHRAKNREGFAKGALDAAKWLIGKKGLYNFDDVIEEMLK